MTLTITLTKPTPGGSLDVWGTILNSALDQINEYGLFAPKTADESVVSSITLQNDDHLVLAVLANREYLVDWSLRIDGATAGDFKYAFTGPAGATMVWESMGHGVADTTNVAQAVTDVAAIGTVVTHGTLGVGTTSRVRGGGRLIVGGTAGNLQLQWAQGTSSASATRVFANSWIRALRTL
jgi:hypothetical protein